MIRNEEKSLPNKSSGSSSCSSSSGIVESTNGISISITESPPIPPRQ